MAMVRVSEDAYDEPVGRRTGDKGWLYVAQVKCRIGYFFSALIFFVGIEFFDVSIARAQ